ncbi:TadE/TadG family type IV pilus assembly protein [Duganella sp. BuS-21]|uniref:TadE/TadG family type IV pilus assembly protein n=1 Tax=Duganella sp. BuS-21 TaxID=2943848 RepID=UPI0035A5CD00
MKRVRGAVALELALVLPTLMVLLVVVLYYGRLAYHYAIVQKSMEAGTRYLSSVPFINIRTSALAQHESNLTQAIVQTELASLGNTALVAVSCNSAPCNMLSGVTPATISITVRVDVPNIFPGYGEELLDQQLHIVRTVRYAGN